LRVYGGFDDHYECVRDVTMLGLYDVPNGPSLVKYEGKHVRISVPGYGAPVNGHHHARVLAAATSVDESHGVPPFSLRSVWSKVKHDLVGVSCIGWPR
jgi:hypothetical protein